MKQDETLEVFDDIYELLQEQITGEIFRDEFLFDLATRIRDRIANKFTLQRYE